MYKWKRLKSQKKFTSNKRCNFKNQYSEQHIDIWGCFSKKLTRRQTDNAHFDWLQYKRSLLSPPNHWIKSVIKEPPTKVIVWGRITSKVVLSWAKIFYTSTGWGWRGKEGCYQNKLGLVSNPHHHWEYFVLALAT